MASLVLPMCFPRAGGREAWGEMFRHDGPKFAAGKQLWTAGFLACMSEKALLTSSCASRSEGFAAVSALCPSFPASPLSIGRARRPRHWQGRTYCRRQLLANAAIAATAARLKKSTIVSILYRHGREIGPGLAIPRRFQSAAPDPRAPSVSVSVV